ncbi:hypothetical protein BZB76_1831 [Actinomadura pelletieri DSM 43383]|uniref:Uncharacterized protein n=2 Tax=Actinomadura pelletieri TaxID=111805 RepID=A0A495QSJ1_9ACTN|nr:hypothetical protein BZB76_1831 [Actinomadura pelletieri DSM 43383]
MRRCDLEVEDCIADHIAPRLDGRMARDERHWNARCPAHDDVKRSLTITRGTRGQRVVWRCHKGCIGQEVKRAMLARGIDPACIPWHPDGPEDQAAELGAEVQELRAKLAEIEKVITGPDAKNVQRMRLLIGMLLWPSYDAHATAERLGIGWRTAYRVMEQIRREKQ